VVPTVDSQRTKYILQNCVNNKIHTLSVGVTGTGKTVLINQILSELDENSWKITNIIFSSQTSSKKTQDMIEGKMTRRTKTKMVPDGKKMIIYVDDLNMPKKDTYGSQPPLELLRQWMDYGGWFDRVQN
jgi:dynein heavy chain